MNYLSISAIVMTSCVMMLNAQSPSITAVSKDPTQQQSKPDYVGLNECMGAKVSMNPGAQALAAAINSKKTATRPTGEITDILIATKTGHTEWAVVSFGGLLGIGDKTIAMPCSVLKWNAKTKCYDADVSHDHVTALNAFEHKKASAQGLDNAMTVHATNWCSVVTPNAAEKSAEEATAVKAAAKVNREDKPVVTIAGTTMVANPSLLMCACKIGDYPLYARGEDFGKVSNCVVDRTNNTLAFAIVGHGGTLGFGKDQYLVPFSALRLAKKVDATVLVVDKTAKEMAACVKYTKPKNGIIDEKTAASCCESMRAKATIGSEDNK